MARSRKRADNATLNPEQPAGTTGSEADRLNAGGNGAAPTDDPGVNGGTDGAESRQATGGGSEPTPGAASPQEGAGPEAPKRRRGRPPGSGKPKAAPDAGLGVGISEEDATQQVAGLYAMLNALTSRPGPDGTIPNGPFMYGVQNAHVIGKELANVSRYYNLSMDGPVLSLMKLGAAAAMVNVPIIAAFGAMRRAERQARAAQPATPEDAVFAAGGDGTERPSKMDFTGENLRH